jgi:hypothetical protein
LVALLSLHHVIQCHEVFVVDGSKFIAKEHNTKKQQKVRKQQMQHNIITDLSLFIHLSLVE